MRSTEELAQRLAARALPIEAKRRLADAGNALDEALTAALEYLGGLDASLGRAAEVSASKMRYQMDRLRVWQPPPRCSARQPAQARRSMTLHLFPNGHLQERVLGGVWFLAAGSPLTAANRTPLWRRTHHSTGGRGCKPAARPHGHPA